jgi:hypothetical protein
MPAKIKFFFIFVLLLFFIITMANPAGAALKFQDAQTGISTTAGQAGVQTADIPTIAASVIKALLGLVGMVFFILFIYGGVQWMTAAGNEEKIRKAKKLIINAVIGIAIITLAYTFTYFISQAIETGGGGVTGGGGTSPEQAGQGETIPTPSYDCSKCGKGVINVCDKTECEGIDCHCVFKWPNSCNEEAFGRCTTP